MEKREKYINILLNMAPNCLFFLKRFIQLSLIRKKGSGIKGLRDATFVGYNTIEIGNNFFSSRGLEISSTIGVNIGDNVTCGPNVIIIGGNHRTDIPGKRINEIHSGSKHQKITIQDDVWIGANAIILSGVTIGEGSIIGAGSVVTKSIPNYCISAGNPCIPIKPRFNTESDLRYHLKTVGSKVKSETR